jgi:transcriptional regulator with XRE-family HTH domain
MRPSKLPGKLLYIRDALGLTQEAMANRLGFPEITREYVSGFELGTREPPLQVLLRYSQIANIYVEALIDDEVELPEKLPCRSKSEGIRRAVSSSKNRTRHPDRQVK